MATTSMELCWCCPRCVRERHRRKQLKQAVPVLAKPKPRRAIHNNNRLKSEGSSPDAPGMDHLSLNTETRKRHVTFVNKDPYLSSCLSHCPFDEVNGTFSSMCHACELRQEALELRQQAFYHQCRRKAPRSNKTESLPDLSRIPLLQFEDSPVTNRSLSAQFAEETDSSHIGPPRFRMGLGTIPDDAADDESLALQIGPHIGQLKNMPGELQALISDLVVPCAVLANNQIRIISVETDGNEVQNLYVDAFLHNNRLEHMIQVMGFHPHYLECFLKTQQYLLRGDGPLPYDYRHYIAIMAAGRHQCSYIIKTQTTEFLLQGGDEKWLHGLQYIPQKLRDLYEINKILAHRPWLLNKSHIEQLTRGTENWSLSELMHAITLLAHFHSLSSFIYGCGINPEIDHDDGHSYRASASSENGATNDLSEPSTPKTGSSESTEGGIEELMRKMRQLTEEAAANETTPEELLKRFEKIESQNTELPSASKQPSVKADLLRYVDDADFMYQDFARRGQPSSFPCFRAQDYSWEEQGFSLANRLYTDIGTYLDDKFRTAYDMTYYTMGYCTDVDTTSFRRAIWNYIHSIFGIRHDDYDYNEVNQLMERSLKTYIKTVTCFPERIHKKDYMSFMKEFKHSEKVHVNLMLLEAKMQAELLYALRAIMKYMT